MLSEPTARGNGVAQVHATFRFTRAAIILAESVVCLRKAHHGSLAIRANTGPALVASTAEVLISPLAYLRDDIAASFLEAIVNLGNNTFGTPRQALPAALATLHHSSFASCDRSVVPSQRTGDISQKQSKSQKKTEPPKSQNER